MHARAADIVAAVRGCVGTRFRAQGRRPGTALDCVGVALVAAEAAGQRLVVPPYSLGGDHEARLDAVMAALGCARRVDAEPGDVVVLAPAASRRHLAVVTDAGLVHAHAGLGRVVEGPCDPAWAVIAAWRFPEN